MDGYNVEYNTYILNVDPLLYVADSIFLKYITIPDSEYLRFAPGKRYPVSGGYGSSNIANPYLSLEYIKDTLLTLIYENKMDIEEFRVNKLFDTKSIYKGKSYIHNSNIYLEEIIYEYIPGISVRDASMLYNIVVKIYNTIEKFNIPSVNIIDIDIETHQFLVIDRGSIYEYRYKEYLMFRDSNIDIG